MEEARFLKRKVRSGNIDIHPTEACLVVNYEIEALILGEDGEPMISDKKNRQKLVKLHNLSESTDCDALATEIVNKCKLIHPSKLEQVRHLLRYLQSRKQFALTAVEKATCVDPDKIDISRLEDYAELLYEDSSKLKGASAICRLCENPTNLNEIANDESVLSALSRILREDWKKNADLSAKLVSVFASFSEYTDFHGLVLRFKIGSLCLEIIEWELSEYSNKKRPVSGNRMSRLPVKKVSQIPQRSQSQIPVKRALSTPSPGKREPSEEEKFDAYANKQNKLLDACFKLLSNISENEKVQSKMTKRGVVKLCVETLKRKHTGTAPVLTKTLLNFMRKLSVYEENVTEITAVANAVEALKSFPALTEECRALLYNLSFDAGCRRQIVQSNLWENVAAYLSANPKDHHSLGILYHLSVDDDFKSKLAGIVPLCASSREEIARALCVNLALDEKCAEVFPVEDVVSEALKGDYIGLKVARNLSYRKGVVERMFVYAGDLLDKLPEANEEFLVEYLGILGNLTGASNFSELLKEKETLSLLKNLIRTSEPDVLLESVVLLGGVCEDEFGAELVKEADLATALTEALKRNQEDDEIVLQILHVFYQLLRHAVTKDCVKKSDIPLYLIDLLHDNNKNVSALCKACLQTIRDVDDAWTEKVKGEKFQWHNAQWLEMIQNRLSDDRVRGDGDSDNSSSSSDAMPRYDLLQQSLMFKEGGSQIFDGSLLTSNASFGGEVDQDEIF